MAAAGPDTARFPRLSLAAATAALAKRPSHEATGTGRCGEMTEVRSWRDRAACRDLVTAEDDPFFADTDQGIQAAIAICATCPVRDDCLTFAVRTGQRYGVWGGQTEQTIRQLIALDRAGRPHRTQAPAGHPNARKTHCKRGHPFDAANTYYAPDGQRRCRICMRAAQPARALKGGGSDAA